MQTLFSIFHGKRLYLQIASALIIWLLIWNRMNLEHGLKLLEYFGVSGSQNQLLLIQSSYMFALLAIVFGLWLYFTRNISFLKTKDKKVFLFYLLPLIIFASILVIKKGENTIDLSTAAFSFFTISFTQDFLTFGILQTLLEKLSNKKTAAILTVIMFFVGHTGFFPLNVFIIFYIVGFVLFGYLRYKYGNIYLLNVLHISFNLFRIV